MPIIPEFLYQIRHQNQSLDDPTTSTPSLPEAYYTTRPPPPEWSTTMAPEDDVAGFTRRGPPDAPDAEAGAEAEAEYEGDDGDGTEAFVSQASEQLESDTKISIQAMLMYLFFP